MNSVSYYELNQLQRQEFFQLLQQTQAETDKPAATNMWSNNPNDSNSLLYLLDHTDRFRKNGMFQVLFDNNHAVACSGAYTSEFSQHVALLGVRSWVQKSYRNRLISRNILLPKEKSWAIETGHKIVALTFNEYNRHLQELFKRKRLGVSMSARSSEHFGYLGTHTVEFPVDIQYTKQYVIYEKLDQQFEFDWSSIEF